jgi:mannose-1-phosphate guanylyltransferase
MLEETCHRLHPLVSWENIVVVAGQEHASHVRRILPTLPRQNLLLEPCSRNTAPCIGLAALHIQRRCPEAVMIVLPADHAVGNPRAFRLVLKTAVATAREQGGLVTIGLTPTRPETGYGYIRTGLEVEEKRTALWVRSFQEKPSRQQAQRFVASGEYLWNSGMFVFQVSTILQALRQFLPPVYHGLARIVGSQKQKARVLRSEYQRLPSISIDYGVMEKVCQTDSSLRLAVVPGNFGWSDVGSWDALAAFWPKDTEGNAVEGKAVLVDTRGAVVLSPSRLVALVGVADVIVIDAGDAVLVCRRSRAQDVRRVVEELEKRGLRWYL